MDKTHIRRIIGGTSNPGLLQIFIHFQLGQPTKHVPGCVLSHLSYRHTVSDPHKPFDYDGTDLMGSPPDGAAL